MQISYNVKIMLIRINVINKQHNITKYVNNIIYLNIYNYNFLYICNINNYYIIEL